jgi:hypothetical protein
LHVTFKEILLQFKNAKYQYHQNGYQQQVIIGVDADMIRKFFTQWQPDIIKNSNLIIQIVKHR